MQSVARVASAISCILGKEGVGIGSPQPLCPRPLTRVWHFLWQPDIPQARRACGCILSSTQRGFVHCFPKRACGMEFGQTGVGIPGFNRFFITGVTSDIALHWCVLRPNEGAWASGICLTTESFQTCVSVKHLRALSSDRSRRLDSGSPQGAALYNLETPLRCSSAGLTLHTADPELRVSVCPKPRGCLLAKQAGMWLAFLDS